MDGTVRAPALGSPLWAHDDLVHPRGAAGSGPSHSLGLFALDPRTDGAFEDDLAAIRLHHDAIGVELGTAFECLLNLCFDFIGLGARLELDQVADALDAFDPPYRILRGLALVLPLDLAFERHPAILDHDFDVLRRDRQLALDCRHGVPCNFGVRPLVDARHSNFDVVRHCSDPGHALGSGFGLVFVGIALDESRQPNDAFLYGDGDVASVEIWIPLKLFFHVAFDFAVGPHDGLRLELAARGGGYRPSALRDCDAAAGRAMMLVNFRNVQARGIW